MCFENFKIGLSDFHFFLHFSSVACLVSVFCFSFVEIFSRKGFEKNKENFLFAFSLEFGKEGDFHTPKTSCFQNRKLEGGKKGNKKMGLVFVFSMLLSYLTISDISREFDVSI